MSLILGLNAYHGDSAACLIRDGKLVAAAEEERFRINRKPGVNNWRRLGFVLTHRPDPRLMIQKIRNIRSAASAHEALEKAYGISLKAQIHHVEHHLAHLASAFLVSRFDEAACISIDGFGDFASTAMGFGRSHSVEIDRRVYFPHSLGIFYSALTQFIGFPHYGDEYKVMGLAPYGNPNYRTQMREIVRVQPDGTFRLGLKYFRHHTDNVSYSWNNCAPEVGTLYTDRLIELLGPARKPTEPLEQKHKDIARSVQAMYEEAFFALLHALYARHPLPNLALSGGCAMNSVANGKVYLRTPFKKMYLPAAAGDAGGAIGGATYVLSRIANSKTRLHLDSAYSGPAFSDHEIRKLIESKNEEISMQYCQVSEIGDQDELCKRTAAAIAEGKVVGWFQGRMEWGPRALGNRSILCDPRRHDMKEILNTKIKRRESFRPFAPSILREAVAEWFEQDDDVPFMMQVFQIRPEKRSLLPAVCHVDGSGRLQTVHADTNPLYHQLISEFCRLTSIPIVLNTSFNENEPVVCRPEEALDCFLRTKMDSLVLGNFWIERNSHKN